MVLSSDISSLLCPEPGKVVRIAAVIGLSGTAFSWKAGYLRNSSKASWVLGTTGLAFDGTSIS
jgi:hypothetical protein